MAKKSLQDLIREGKEMGKEKTKPAADAGKEGPTRIPGDKGLIEGVTEVVSDTSLHEARKGYTKTKRFFSTIWNYTRPFRRFCAKVAKPYGWLLKKTSRDSYENNWAKNIASFGRGLLLVTTFGLTPFIGSFWKPIEEAQEVARYFTTEPAYDLTRMAFFGVQKDTLYLNSYSEVDHDNGLFTVKGCRDPGACNDESTVFFRAEPRLVNNFRNLAQGKNFFFDPGREVASIAPGNTEFAYVVESVGYGWRASRMLRAYPHIYSIERISMPANKAFSKETNTVEPSVKVATAKDTVTLKQTP